MCVLEIAEVIDWAGLAVVFRDEANVESVPRDIVGEESAGGVERSEAVRSTGEGSGFIRHLIESIVQSHHRTESCVIEVWEYGVVEKSRP